MNLFLKLAYLFFIGSVLGWVLELFYRRFISGANPERKWINPGFCVGPYVPLYGSGLCILYLLASFGDAHGTGTAGGKVLLIAGMALSMTAIEYIAGLMSLKLMHIRLWDYSSQWGNIQGLICPQFSLIWAAASAGYYFLVHPHILDALKWLSENLAFSFVIGYFFGVFTIDVVYSAHLLTRIRQFAKENEVDIKVERLKSLIRSRQDERREKANFLFAFRSSHSLAEHLREAQEAWEERRRVEKSDGTHLYRRYVKWITFTARSRRNAGIPSRSTRPASFSPVTRRPIRRTSTACSATVRCTRWAVTAAGASSIWTTA